MEDDIFVGGDPQPDADATDILALPDGESPSEARWADDARHATALTWVDPLDVAAPAAPVVETASGESLFRGAHLRRAISRAGLLVPIITIVALVGGYAGTTLLWPLHEIPPTVKAVEFAVKPAPAATVTWPTQGSAAVGIAGMNTVASGTSAVSIASISKVVTALMVLDRKPLALGQQGPDFSFTKADGATYQSYRSNGQSSLAVPVGGKLTEYQLLQGALMGSANNYIDRLARDIWGSNDSFADAAATWLRERGLDGITLKTPSGFDKRNVASPAALIKVGEWAMKNPVFAEIVGTKTVTLPAAGAVTNTNEMLGDAGVVGIKTGTLVGFDLLAAKNFTVGGTQVHIFATVLDQADDAQRVAATRSLFSELEATLKAQAPAVPKGTIVGTVTTMWGEKVNVVTKTDAKVVLWNGAAATGTPEFDLGDHREGGDKVGTLTTTGPLNTAATPLTLAADVEGPSPWWRLTHPLDLLGITKH